MDPPTVSEIGQKHTIISIRITKVTQNILRHSTHLF